jgi:hypothetical protein
MATIIQAGAEVAPSTCSYASSGVHMHATLPLVQSPILTVAFAATPLERSRFDTYVAQLSHKTPTSLPTSQSVEGASELYLILNDDAAGLYDLTMLLRVLSMNVESYFVFEIAAKEARTRALPYSSMCFRRVVASPCKKMSISSSNSIIGTFPLSSSLEFWRGLSHSGFLTPADEGLFLPLLLRVQQQQQQQHQRPSHASASSSAALFHAMHNLVSYRLLCAAIWRITRPTNPKPAPPPPPRQHSHQQQPQHYLVRGDSSALSMALSRAETEMETMIMPSSSLSSLSSSILGKDNTSLLANVAITPKTQPKRKPHPWRQQQLPTAIKAGSRQVLHTYLDRIPPASSWLDATERFLTAVETFLSLCPDLIRLVLICTSTRYIMCHVSLIVHPHERDIK